jgi:CheY-like chemotaxis protein
MSAPSAATAPKLLIIDSNVFFAKRLADALKHEGFEVIHSTQSAYALTMLEWNMPTAILCATNLREMGAYEIPRILRADTKTAQIPIIAVGDGGEMALMQAYRAGCDDYVDRRLGPENIAAHVRTFLRSQRDGFQPTQMLGSSETALEGSLSHLDLPGVIQMLGHSRQTGALHINAGATDGIIFFDAGEISHAESGDRIGDDAVIYIVKTCDSIEKGVYKFVPGDTACTRTVLRSATELMLDALRSLDEERDLAGGGV